MAGLEPDRLRGKNRINFTCCLIASPAIADKPSLTGNLKEGPYTGRCSRQDLQSGKRALYLADAAMLCSRCRRPVYLFFSSPLFPAPFLSQFAICILQFAICNFLFSITRGAPSDFLWHTQCSKLSSLIQPLLALRAPNLINVGGQSWESSPAKHLIPWTIFSSTT